MFRKHKYLLWYQLSIWEISAIVTRTQFNNGNFFPKNMNRLILLNTLITFTQKKFFTKPKTNVNLLNESHVFKNLYKFFWTTHTPNPLVYLYKDSRTLLDKSSLCVCFSIFNKYTLFILRRKLKPKYLQTKNVL